jgi:hypothetical protein
MPIPSFQFANAHKYLSTLKGMNQGMVSAGRGSDMVSNVGDVAGESPLPISAQTIGGFNSQVAWRSSHGSTLKGLQRANIKSIYDFNTNQVDPSVR